MIVSAVTLLPQPDSPTIAERLAALDGEADAVDGLDDAVHDVEVGPQVANLEQDVRVRRAAPSARCGTVDSKVVTRVTADRARRAGRHP